MLRSLLDVRFLQVGLLSSIAISNVHAQNIPVRAVAVQSVSTEKFFGQPMIRHLPDGRVLLNDPTGKRLIVFDSTLSKFTVSADTNSSGGGTLYPPGPFRIPLTPLGDSTLFVDMQAQSLLVIGPDGRALRTIAHPRPNDLVSLLFGAAGTDPKGRLIYRGESTASRARKPGDPPNRAVFDTIGIVRADFDTRGVDTIGSFVSPRAPQTEFITTPGGKTTGARKINPVLPAPDEWAVMSDGTLAIVRGHDYHIDFVEPNGTKSATPKLPFDWKRLTDADKQARIDSMKRAIDSVNASGSTYGVTIRSLRTSDGVTKRDTIVPVISFVPIGEIADYVPPIREGAVKADADNNLWILPTTSAQVGPGLLYDVVNRKGELFQRVRLPVNTVLIGFGKGGVVYFAQETGARNTWTLGRGRIAK